MTDIQSKIESAISKMKEADSDLLIVESQLLNFDIPHILRDFHTTLDYLHNHFNGSVNHFYERAIMKFTIVDIFTRCELEVELLGETHLNIYTNPKTRQFEGESLGFRFKDWQIVNYHLELYYEGI
jgi:hypothetical protein